MFHDLCEGRHTFSCWLQSWQKLMTHEELFVNTRLYAPSPLAMLIPELRKHAICHLPIHLQIA